MCMQLNIFFSGQLTKFQKKPRRIERFRWQLPSVAEMDHFVKRNKQELNGLDDSSRQSAKWTISSKETKEN